MPRYEERDFPPDIELLVSVCNWCLDPSRPGWQRMRAAMQAADKMPPDMGPVLVAARDMAAICDGIPDGATQQEKRAALARAAKHVARQRRANAVRPTRTRQDVVATQEQWWNQ